MFAGSPDSDAQFVVHSVAMFHSASNSDSAVDPSATAEIGPSLCSRSHFHPTHPFTSAPSSGSTGISQRRETAVMRIPRCGSWEPGAGSGKDQRPRGIPAPRYRLPATAFSEFRIPNSEFHPHVPSSKPHYHFIRFAASMLVVLFRRMKATVMATPTAASAALTAMMKNTNRAPSSWPK